jgi:hypothetical protein
VAVLLLEGVRQALGKRGNALAARGELLHQRPSDASDLAAVTVGALDPFDAELAAQRRLHHQGGDRRCGAAVLIERFGVRGAPRAVAFALDAVEDQVVDVELGVAVAAGVLGEAADDELVGVFPAT